MFYFAFRYSLTRFRLSNMETFYIITGFLSIVALLCFFVLCNNVDKIRLNSQKQTLMLKKMFEAQNIALDEKETRLLNRK